MNSYFKIILFILLISPIYQSFSQDSIRSSIFMDAGILFHENAYKQSNYNFLNFETCDLNSTGNDFAYSMAFNIAYKYNNQFNFGLRISNTDKSGIITQKSTYELRDYPNGNLVNAQVSNNISINLNQLELKPYFEYIIKQYSKNSIFSVFAGPQFSLASTGKYQHYNLIESPETIFFKTATGKKSKELDYGGENFDSKFSYGFSIGLTNRYTIGKSFYLLHSLSYEQIFGNLYLNNPNPNHITFNMGFGYRFDFKEEAPIPENIEIKVDTIVKAVEIVQIKVEEKKTPSIKLQILDHQKDLNIIKGLSLVSTLPHVNSVFFDKNSADIRAKYLDLNNLVNKSNDPIVFNYSILYNYKNILKDHPDVKLKIIAFTSGIKDEDNNSTLAKKRAENIYNFFVENGVSTNQLITDSKINPIVRSNDDFLEGLEENRRADLILENYKSNSISHQVDFISVKGLVEVYAELNNIDSTKSATLENSLSRNDLKLNKSGKYYLPFDINVNDDVSELMSNTNLKYENMTESYSKVLELNKINVNDSIIDYSKFKLILRFDYDKSNLTSENKKLLSEFVNLVPNSYQINILASSDALGTEKRNAELTQERLATTLEYFKSIDQQKFRYSSEINNAKFDQTNPIGRFLNRSITITLSK